MNTVRTVSDTKRAFYATHTRPINSIYRRVVEEMMVEMHLLSVNTDFSYDPIYALGIVTAFDRFMQGYRPEQDRQSIFNALCHALGQDAQQYRQDADRLLADAAHHTSSDFLTQLDQLGTTDNSDLFAALKAIAENETFKYNRPFVIGLYRLLEQMNPDILKDEKQRNQSFEALATALKISGERIQKDLELYRSNLDKLTQAQQVMDDILKADRKKKEEREQARQAMSTPPSTPQESA